MISVKTHIVHLESQTLFCTHPPSQIDLDRYFLPLSRQNRSLAIIMDSGSTLLILFNFQKSTHTLFLLHHDDGRHVLPSPAYCPHHSVALPWHTARDKSYNILVCHLSASLCAESHRRTGHICQYIRVPLDQVLQHISLVFRQIWAWQAALHALSLLVNPSKVLFLELPLDLGLATFTHVKASSPSS